jgi:S1-C subfamily serine protease
MSPAFEEASALGMTLSQMYDYTTRDEDKRGSVVVLDVKRGSPAHKVGILKGDIILKIDNVITKHHNFKEIIADCLMNKQHLSTTLTLWRPGNKEQLTFVMCQ